MELGADLHMAQLMPLLLTVSCFSKIQIGFAFLVPAHPGSTGKTAVKRVCVSLCLCLSQVPKLESYVSYCSNQIYVKSLLDMKKLDPAIDDFLDRCQESPFSRRLDLWSFLG